MSIYLYSDAKHADVMLPDEDVLARYTKISIEDFLAIAHAFLYRLSVPREIANVILRQAGFAYVIEKETHACIRGSSDMDDLYLELEVPLDALPRGICLKSCDLIACDFSAHDQGWASSYPALHGSYQESYTWAEIALGKRNEKGIVELEGDRVIIGYNKRASSREFYHHRRVFASSDNSTLLSGIRQKSVLHMYLRSQYPGWANSANFGSMKAIFTLEATEDMTIDSLSERIREPYNTVQSIPTFYGLCMLL